MAPTKTNGSHHKSGGRKLTAQPNFHQHAPELQAFGTVELYPIGLEEVIRREVCDKLNQLLADVSDVASNSASGAETPLIHRQHVLNY